MMKTLLLTLLTVFSFLASFSQSSKLKSKKYPSLLWEITGKGTKPSYLFGTMHVSSKMVFHLSDSFYLGLKSADIVALETNPGNWQEDFSRYDLEGGMYNYALRGRGGEPNDYLSINTLRAFPYEKLMGRALYSSPSIINSFLYRTNSEVSSDFEEDTYLDLYIYQVGRKWNKKVCGVENFDESMTLMREAYADAAKDKNLKERSYDIDNDFSYGKLEEAYRTGNLDLLDTINKVNSASAAFDEKFLYRRNEIQAASIDSILNTKASLFVGVGAAHLPGERGVIELLRRMGYKLRPIKMTERDSRHKDEIESIRVPVQFSTQASEDDFFSVDLPGKLYSFSRPFGPMKQQQYADMSNGSYYMISRIYTNAALWGHGTETVYRKVDSVLYENIPGKILSKQAITKNGYRGFNILNRTRRGDYQRYNIFITPFEIIVFKISGNGEYVKLGREADQFFNSIRLKEYKTEWKKYTPPFGGFEAEMPHQPIIANAGSWKFMSYDPAMATSYEVIRTDVYNLNFAEEDSFDLNLLEESFGSSDFIEKQTSRKHTRQNGYAALEARYRYKDGSVALVKFIIQGPHYYTLVANAAKENSGMTRFLSSFSVKPYVYGEAQKQTDTALCFTVSSPVPVLKQRKLDMYPQEIFRPGAMEDDSFFEANGEYRDRIVVSDSTGEKIYVSFYKPSRYEFDRDTTAITDSSHYKTYDQDWTVRHRKEYQLPGKIVVREYELGDPKSSRVIRGKSFNRNGVYHRITVQGDTLSQWSSFVSHFFRTFSPADTVKGGDPLEKKAALFFDDFFSKDSLLHKRAVKNVHMLKVDSSDFVPLKNVIQALSWKEKKYLDIKNAFIYKLSSIPTKASADYLKQVYYAAGDTVDMQYTALEALLQQKKLYAYQVFRDIMMDEPPVLQTTYNAPMAPPPVNTGYSEDFYDEDRNSNNGSFLDELKDSLALTKAIFRDLLPLINVNDYEQPMMNLLETMVDSNMISAKEYELYFPKFLIEAKQEMKKQIITEKNRSIEKAQADPDEKRNSYYEKQDRDYGNRKLSAYATLLMPFWDANASVPVFFRQLLHSNDRRLKYNTAILLLRNKRAVPDTLVTYYALQDDYRYELYADLKDMKRTSLFPKNHNHHVALAKSKLVGLNSYESPDTIAYLDRLPVQYKNRKGFVYFFKYRQKKDDNAWKLATVGLVPADAAVFEFEKAGVKTEYEYNFTEMTSTKLDEEEPLKGQLQKLLKRKLYSKRKSGERFYDEENRYSQFASVFNFRD